MSRNDAAVRAIREAAARRGNEARVTELSAPRLCALRRRARAARPLTVLLTLDDLLALVEDLAGGPA